MDTIINLTPQEIVDKIKEIPLVNESHFWENAVPKIIKNCSKPLYPRGIMMGVTMAIYEYVVKDLEMPNMAELFTTVTFAIIRKLTDNDTEVEAALNSFMYQDN